MPKKIEFNGLEYVPLRHAAVEVNLSQDYMSRLCKKGVFDTRREKSAWYVNMESVRTYLQEQQEKKEARRRSLALQRLKEYQESVGAQTLVIPTPLIAVEDVARGPDGMKNIRPEVPDNTQQTAFPAFSARARLTSALHATANMPAQSLAHIPIPTHFISPTMDLVHRVVALLGAVVLVFGTYSFVDPIFARTVTDSGRAALLSVSDMTGEMLTAITVGSRAASLATAEFAKDPAHDFTAMSVQIRAVYTSARGRMSPHYAADTAAPEMTASAALAQPQVVASVPRPLTAAVPATADPSALGQAAAAGVSQDSGAGVVTAVGFAQPIAIAVPFSGSEIAYGDIVSFNAENGQYTLSQGSDDPNLYGIVVRDPALLFKPDGTKTNIAVTRSGSALINVTLENGPIATGDQLTSSSIPGKARRANEGEHVIATAAEPFDGGGVVIVAPGGARIESGTITSSVRAAANGASASSASVPTPCTSLRCRLISLLDPLVVRTLVRYLLSGVIAALTVTLAFKSFMSDANYGVISIGRNPRAKTSIQSLVLFNAVLALVIASVGLFAAMIVLFAG